MNRHVDELLARQREEALRPEEWSVAAVHLDRCERCRRLAAALERADELLSASEPPVIVPALRPARPRRSLAYAPMAAAGLALVLGAAAGLALGEWRSDFAQRGQDPATADPGPPAPLHRPGEDLLYVADGRYGAERLSVIAMPEGRMTAQFDFQALAGSLQEGPPPNVAGGFAFFSRTVAEEPRRFRTTLERIELRTGERRSVDAGAVEFAGILAVGGDHEARDLTEAEVEMRVKEYAEMVARSYANVVVAPDASTVLLIRPHAGAGSAVRVDRFDGRTMAHLGTRVWIEDPLARFVAPDANGFLHIRYEHPDVYSQRQIWTVLDRELREVATITAADAVAWPNYCSPDIRALPGGRTWVTVCDQHRRAYFLQFIDRERLTDAGKVELSDGNTSPAALLAWHVADDGTIIVLTDRPSLIRIDPVARRLIDHRLISRGGSFPPSFGAIPSNTHPRVQFSADGRLLFIAYLGHDGRSWWAPLSLVDVGSGRVVATAFDEPNLEAVYLSPDGARLYVIHDRRIAIVDPGTLRVVSVTERIVTSPASLLTVVSRD